MSGSGKKDSLKSKKESCMKTVCSLNMCTACMACVSICPRKAITVRDDLKYQNAVIEEQKCIDCGLCEKVCQVVHPLPLRKPLQWYQGWCNDLDDRKKSASGAFAYSMAKQIISEGGFVAACRFEKGRFLYSLAGTESELDRYRGSNYVKSDPTGIYPSVKDYLVGGNQVLFIGLPCHVAALKRYLGKEYDNLITVDLICHGSPSPMLLEMFLNQYHLSLSSISSIHFRKKGFTKQNGSPDNFDHTNESEISFTEPGIRDRYTIAFLYGLNYTENCYHCAYAGTVRGSDITIGDSWGNEFNIQEKQNGVSLALCQTEKGVSFLKRCQLDLQTVNIQRAVESNHQLREPFPMPAARNTFFDAISKGTSFNNAVKKSIPKACFRLDMKDKLLKIGICKDTKERAIDYKIFVGHN